MRILFIGSSTKEIYRDLKDSAPQYPPLGLAYMASVLEKEKFEVKIIDLAVENIKKDDLIKIIESYSPKIIGFSAVTPIVESAYKLIDFLKPHFQDITFIIGGPHPTALPEEAVRHADIIIRGEGERTIVEIAKAIKKNKTYKKIDGISFIHNGKIIHNKPMALIDDLDEIPYPARNLLPMDKYQYLSGKKTNISNIMFSRGCPFQCNYCNKNIFGYKTRLRSVENIIGEMDELVNEFNVNEIHISDDNFNFNRKNTMELCKTLKKRKLKINFFPHGGVRVNSVDSEQLKALKEVGFFAMIFGVESGNQQILNNIKKGITLQQARDAFKLAHKIKFDEIWGYFIFGLKGETIKTARETIKFAIELDPTIAKFHILVPLPGTEYYNELKSQNRLRIKRWSDFAIYSDPSFIPQNMTVQQLINIHKEAYRKFFFRPKIAYRVVNMAFKNPQKILSYGKAGLSILNLTNKK